LYRLSTFEQMSWPLHEIKESFNRIGAQKPKIFGLMDFTQGFRQAPLTLTTRVYTAFIVFCGIYQFTRLPFGLKGAPSYFQQTIATVVLAGLFYFTCEVYTSMMSMSMLKTMTNFLLDYVKYFNVLDITKFILKLLNAISVTPNSTIWVKSFLL
jgi:hypothetical protein